MSPVPTDPYNFANGATADADQVDARFLPLYTALSAALDETNLAAALKAILGVSDAGVVRRGKSIIATEESRTNVAYGLLTTPDRVSSVELPADGLMLITYAALWKESVAGAARAAIFLGANQLKVHATPIPVVTEAQLSGGAANVYTSLKSAADGITSDSTVSGAYGAPVTTGMFRGGLCVVEAAAGTYDVSVQFKASSGSVTAKNRALRVVTLGF